MNCLAWNCRGSGNPQTVREIKNLLRDRRCEVCFISETKDHSMPNQDRFDTLNLPNSFFVPAIGQSGGLWLGWSDNIDLEILDFSNRFISTVIKDSPPGSEWLCTFTYGHPDHSKRHELWESLSSIANTINKPWVIMGDLNEITTQSDRIGGNPYNPADNKYFSDFILNTGTIDLGFDGVPFTWCNNQFGNNGIRLQRQRLDRALANCDWRTLFPNARVVNLPITKFSDHSPMVV
ncbi:hypothetical protein ACHQM5_011426 [Ranunculus cassubicifolius]